MDQIVTWNYGSLAQRNKMLSEAEVYTVLRNIVVETLLAVPDEVTAIACCWRRNATTPRMM